MATLGEAPYSEINGYNFVEWDGVHLATEFMALWLLHDYQTVADCSQHATGGQPLPKEIHDQLRKGMSNQQPNPTNNQP